MRAPDPEYGLHLVLRSIFLLFLLCGAGAASADITSAETCRSAIAENPETAREDAAFWYRTGGGVAARLCEASALEAMGATATAARILTGIAENPNRAMDAVLRATVFTDGARLWLDAGRPDLTLEALRQAETLLVPGPDTVILRARAEAALGDWPAALATIGPVIEKRPDDAGVQAFLAAALQETGKYKEARAAATRALEIDPDQPYGLLQLAEADAALGDVSAASDTLFRLIDLYPDGQLAAVARQRLQSLR